MMKPSKRKAAPRRKKTARKAAPVQPVPQVEEAPTTEVEALKAEIAKFDHDGDGHVGGSLPHAAEPSVKAPAPTPAPETDARSQVVKLGPVECGMRRIPLKSVLGLLSPDGLRRMEAYKSTASFESTCKRLLATDGHATPVFFAAPELAGGQPTILHGYEELAAAQVSSIPEISVVLVPPGGVSLAQQHIVEIVRQQNAKGQKPSDDDELFYRVHAEG